MSVCRVCLCSKPRRHISELKLNANDANESCEEIMLFCLGIEVFYDMDIKLCVKCFRKILEFHRFKSLALKNDEYLRTAADKQEVINEVFMAEDIKKEALETSDNDNVTESLEEPEIEVKQECKEEDSDDELLCVLKEVKNRNRAGTKGILKDTVKKKKGRPKKAKTKVCKAEEKKICDECGKEVKNLKDHLKLHIPTELRQRFKCELCDKVFATRGSKRKHIVRKHLGIKKTCHLCNKSVTNLRAHILTMHNKEELPFECVPCGRRFLTSARLAAHVSVHTKDRPHACDICGNRFRIKLSLSMHIRQVHDKEKTHLCQFCSKSFFKKHHLQVHLRSHTKEKPYKCPDCFKYYTSSTVLNNHRLTHSSEKKFPCTLCDSTFATPSNLRSHMQSHIKEKRYPCQYCDVRFHRSDHRKRHEYTAHVRHAAAAAGPAVNDLA